MSLRDDNSLKDKHLQQALKHAPDSDLAPSELVRKNVLNYAKKSKLASQKSHRYWLAGLLTNIKNWQWAGMSSVAVALLAVLMLREQLPEEPIWRESRLREVAQNKAPAPEIVLKEERADMAAPASIQEEAPARTAGAQEKTKVETSATTPELADKDSIVVAATPAAASPAPAGDVIAALPEQEAAKPTVVAKKSERLEDASGLDAVKSQDAAKAQGVAKARQDIQAGELRILVHEWSAIKPLLDEATGYRVELTADLTPAELEAYNQTMRDWFRMQH